MYFSETVYAHNGKLRSSLSVVHDVQVDEFFELQGGGFHIFYYMHKQHGDILASGHGVDDSPEGFLLLVDIRIIELILELFDFSSSLPGHANF